MRIYLWLIPLLPLAGVLINGFFGHRLPRKLSGAIACLMVFGSLVISLGALLRLIGMPPESRVIHHTLFTWIATGNLYTSVSLLLDPLSAVMICVVCCVGFLIHVYSMGYMAHDPRYHRFFAFLNLFTFSMLMLVLADNFLLMFVGWEGVGLCSYLLIGFWYEKKSAADAGKKAFLVNRVGDFGFLLGMTLIFATFGTLTFRDVFQQVAGHPEGVTGVLTLICLLLFAGATGKSAQIPLYVWLPDAMEGPTPVSALIHAATMVTAGVYLIARCHIMFEYAPAALLVVACIGAATAFFSATIGLVQNDIKRVLAYSTVSQLGYMFLSCGVGAFSAAIFHLMTHAFFKALLFLGAGSVMHGVGNETDIRKMGGIGRHMPITCATFWIGTLAIAGIPFFSGFFSKDEILWMSLAGPLGHPLFYAAGLITAVLTAFYMARLTFKTFHGQSRLSGEAAGHVHESPSSMAYVLVLLAIGAAAAGFLNVPHVLGGHSEFAKFLEPVAGSPERVHELYLEATKQSWMVGEYHFGRIVSDSSEIPLMGLAVISAIVAIGAGGWMYVKRPGSAAAFAGKIQPVYNTLANKYWVDEFYGAVIVRPGMALSFALWRGVDVFIIDGLVNLTAWMVGIFSRLFRVLQTGYVRNYAMGMLAGAVFIIWALTR